MRPQAPRKLKGCSRGILPAGWIVSVPQVSGLARVRAPVAAVIPRWPTLRCPSWHLHADRDGVGRRCCADVSQTGENRCNQTHLSTWVYRRKHHHRPGTKTQNFRLSPKCHNLRLCFYRHSCFLRPESGGLFFVLFILKQMDLIDPTLGKSAWKHQLYMHHRLVLLDGFSIRLQKTVRDENISARLIRKEFKVQL